ncbi:sigma-54-dependent Fis family transcriptional regulator [Thiocapsa imhoffii]|uniref:Sigma-54-dependent Fis family transcriptional regulator n=1 Tax=Thiocapsa imhoffii TaxID=382777 RepID=A0A9X1B9C3_9GAMM|nr:sigma 54-interacting transcriptional regulator [Thiocapsa imhoffii]MBK1644930.1 sigma-54-dependent Fis family transcriptional regulator [Thiocapsa imhoffii]
MKNLIGDSPAMRRLRNTLPLVAAAQVGVLLRGEPGTGKESLARAIHAASAQRSGPFVTFACTGAPPEAFARTLGQLPSGPAVLYLDEVGELNAEEQARLLFAIAGQDGAVAPAPLRIIAATSQDLDGLVRQGRFRRDLDLRLCVVPLEVPPLRERLLDLPALTAQFIAQAAQRHRLEPVRLKPSAERLLRRYLWPGNLRELANLCERLVILLPGTEIGPENLPSEILRGTPPSEQALGIALPPHGIDLNDLEAELIRQALSLSGGNKSRAARLLGLTRDTLLYRLQKHLIVG